MPQELTLDIRPFGPDPAALQRLGADLVEHRGLRSALEQTRHQLLSVEPLESDKKVARPRAVDRFRATIYDYTNNRTLLADSSLRDPDRVQLSESGVQPVPSPEEFASAVAVLERDPKLGPALRQGRLKPYEPMPPLIVDDEAGGGLERVLAVGLLPSKGDRGHEIVGVNMTWRSALRFDNRAPATAPAHNPICGQPYAGQPTAVKGTAGMVWVTVSQGGTVLWKFLAVRPAASSGTNGSGVELRYVDYKGKRLLYRAHVPILNVQYQNNACGPYLDWQWQEGMIEANGADVGPGFRLCPAPAQTILDTGQDAGNFLGTAIYVKGQEVVLVSEMQAGWYRYVSEWRLHTNGTIRPRFGFGATSSSCVCSKHYHHAYWRLDFDLRTAGNNVVREFNDPPLFGASKWHTKRFETQRPRNPSRNRKWRVQNTTTGEAYDVVPGPGDGVATSSPDWPFPQGDAWFVRYRGTELVVQVSEPVPHVSARVSSISFTWVPSAPIVASMLCWSESSSSRRRSTPSAAERPTTGAISSAARSLDAITIMAPTRTRLTSRLTARRRGTGPSARRTGEASRLGRLSRPKYAIHESRRGSATMGRRLVWAQEGEQCPNPAETPRIAPNC